MRQLGLLDLDMVEMLFDALHGSPFFVKNQERRYVAANMAMARLCGVDSPRNLYGRCAADFFPQELAERYEMLDAQVLASGRAVTNLLEKTVPASGNSAVLLFSRVPVRAADGACVGVAATSQRLDPGTLTDAEYQRLRLCTDRLRAEFDQPLRLGRLAAEAGSSESQIERDFRKILSVTPQGFLHKLRLDEARRRLEDGTASIAQIAYECGYTDQSAFTRRFVSVIGITPTACRRAHRNASRESVATPSG